MQRKETTRLIKEIKNKLEAQNISQREYSKKINVSESTFSNYMAGLRQMPFDILTLISNDLDLDLNYIFKTGEKLKYSLEDSEELFYLKLRNYPEEKRNEIYKTLLSLIDTLDK